MSGVDDWPVHLRHLVILHGPNVVWNACLDSLGYPAWMCHTNAEAAVVAESIKRTAK